MEEILVKIHARKGKRSELLQTCRLISEQTLQVPGCTGSFVIQDNDRDDLITLRQQWDQRSPLNDYFRSKHFTALLGAMKWLGRSFEIQINRGNHEEGMKAVQLQRMV